MADYQGWSNSATFLTNQYVQQEGQLHTQIAALHKAGVLTANTLQTIAPVKVNTDDEADCGYVKGVLYLDAWAEGDVNWDEMVENWQQELGRGTAANRKD